jgi:LmbE family N-acetylglucosaminyl deacetylase
MRKVCSIFCLFFFGINGFSQTPRSYTSSEILNHLKKLNVLGSVLYVAAHPDDENTRLLAYLANEKLYRTGYLSITRGDGGQNLIGDEQGVELGLIRTQELLAARRIDGAEQFFTSAYDFGFSKNPEETFRIWDKEKILADVVWVIRKFKPDVIICRFPTTGEGGHGHHTASAILAEEAFTLAADPNKYKEQFKFGVEPWQAKRLLWNAFVPGNSTATNDKFFKLDVGGYNPLLGKSYGEIAAESRSMHKSQGFGVPRTRGSQIENFKLIKGEPISNDLMEGVTTDWSRVKVTNFNATSLSRDVQTIINDYSISDPARSVKPLVKLYRNVSSLPLSYWRTQKLDEISRLVEAASGLYLEAITTQPFAVQGDSLHITTVVNNRSGVKIDSVRAALNLTGAYLDVAVAIERNKNVSEKIISFIKQDQDITSPYWLRKPLLGGRFEVSSQSLIGLPELQGLTTTFKVNIEGTDFSFVKPVLHKSNDPVKGEIYQPVNVIAPLSITATPEVLITRHGEEQPARFVVKTYKRYPGYFSLQDLNATGRAKSSPLPQVDSFKTNQKLSVNLGPVKSTVKRKLVYQYNGQSLRETADGFKIISYDHIPDILVPTTSSFTIKPVDLTIAGKRLGYIAGAGDKVPEALMQMGYDVVMLQEKDLISSVLKNFDAIVTGVRAHNVHTWLSDAHEVLMKYVQDGGVLVVQYNTNNNAGPIRSAKISPYPFNISRARITDEKAAVKFVDPAHPVLNYPNKITEADFNDWIQERSIYHAEGFEANYKPVVSMNDPGETEHKGSLIVSDYGKGRFIYTGLAFFRQLPAGVTGAYRLFANLLARPTTTSK